MSFLLFVIVILIIVLVPSSLRIIKQYELGVVFRLGKIRKDVKQPGLCFIIPFIDNLKKISLRCKRKVGCSVMDCALARLAFLEHDPQVAFWPLLR